METSSGMIRTFRLCVLFVPTEGYGALETFLLQAVAKQDPYDAAIVDPSEEFAKSADPEGHHLSKRGYRTKAAFDAFFSVRAAPNQFGQRREVFLRVDWENYVALNEGFAVLSEL